MGPRLMPSGTSDARLGETRSPRWTIPLLVAAAAALLVLPTVVRSGYFTHIMIMVVFTAYLGVAWNILGGFAGQMSMGHGVFLGLGAYMSTLLYVRLGVNPWIAMFASALACAVVAALIGYLLFRLRDAFFALSTMALLKVVTLLVVYFRGITNGNIGISLPMREGFEYMMFREKTGYFYMALALLAVGTVAAHKIRYSRLGLNLLAVRDDHDAAESMGVDSHMAKVTALAISAALVSIGGSFYTHYVLYIDPQSIFDPKLSLQMALVSILGGLGTVTGPIVGAILMVPVDAMLRAWFGGQVAGLNLVIYGLLIMAVVRFVPEGIVPRVMSRRKRHERLTRSEEADHHDSSSDSRGEDLRSVAIGESSARHDDPILSVRGLGVQFGGLTAVKEFDVDTSAGEILGLIGPNGAGKTTVFNAITGYIQPTSGTLRFCGREIKEGTKPHRLCRMGLTRTFQIVKPFRHMSVLENVMVGTIAQVGDYDEAKRRALALLEGVGLDRHAQLYPGSLTIAGQKKLELARALATRPVLLMLDEPMAGLNPNEVEDMVLFVKRIAGWGTSVIIIEHVMKAVMSLCERVVVLDHGERIAEGSPRDVANNGRVIDVYLGERYDA